MSISKIKDSAGTSHDIVAAGVTYCTCSTAAGTAAKVATVVSGSFTLFTGATVIVKFTNANSVASPTLNVNSTGAKPIYRYGTTTASTGTTTTGWVAGAVQMFTYDGTGWIRDYWNNTTYSNVSLGQGYGTCSTAAATAAKVGTLSSYALTTGGIVSVKFTYAVPANATLNINSKGAKSIYYRGAAITADVIKAGDVATFIYSSQYHLISIDRWQEDIENSITGLSVSGKTITYTKGDGTTGTITTQDTVYTHPSHTAVTGVPTADQTPNFGGTFNVNQVTNNALGHVTSNTSRKITIPSTLSNGTGTAGLIKTSSTVTSNSGYTACPVISGVPYYKDTNTTYSLSSFGVTATAAELNALDGITATVTELNYCDGVTSNIQTQLNAKVPTSRTVNGKALSANITLSASDVGATKTTVYTGTIGTSWTENESTGAKTQNVAISGVTASHTAKVDVYMSHTANSDGYATFVEEQNQFLDCITNGYAETYAGGIKFTIFGDANTVSIPIVVEVV